MRPSVWRALLIGAGLVLIILPRLATLGAFVAFDEPVYWQWSNQFFQALMQRDWAATLVGIGNPGVTVLLVQSLGLLIRYLLALLSGVPPAGVPAYLYLDQEIIVFHDLALRRLPMTLLNIILLIWLLYLVYRQFGPRLTLAATTLLGLDPFLLSDSRTMRADALMSVLMTISAISLFIYVDEGKRRFLLISGLCAGFAFANKVSTVAMGPFVLSLVALLVFQQARREGWRRGLQAGLVCLLVWNGLLILVLAATWPALWVVPWDALKLMTKLTVDTGLDGRLNYFMGQVYTVEPLPFFYIVTGALRLSPLALIGLLAGLVALRSPERLLILKQAILAQARLAGSNPRARALLTAAALSLYAASVWLVMTIGVFKREHYVMPAFPALDIVGALGLVWLIQLLIATGSQRRPGWQFGRSPGAALGLIFILQAALVMPHHPYYYTYFNPLILGSRWAYQTVQVGWGADLGEVARYLNGMENAAALKVASPTVRKFIPEFKGTAIRFVYGQPWIQADYLVIPAEDLQYKKIQPAYYDYTIRQPLIREVILGGVPFAWIYQGPAAEHYANSKLDGLGLLLGYDLGQDPVPVGDAVPLKLFWQNDGAGPDHDFFIRLLSADGYIWSEQVIRPRPTYEKAALTDEAIVESEVQLAPPPGTPPGLYFLAMGFRSEQTGETLGLFTLPDDGDKVTITRPNGPPPAADLPIAHPLGEVAAPQVTLLGYSLADDLLTRSEPNWLTLFWQAGSAVVNDYAVALQLFDSQNQEAAYWLGRPVMSGYPTSEWTAGEVVRDPWRLELPAELSPGNYTLRLTLFNAQTQAKAGRLTLGDLAVVERRQRFDPPQMAHVIKAGLDDKVTLLGYDLLAEPITGGGRLRLTLYWQARQAMDRSYTVFAHLLAPGGNLAAQHDGVPAGGAIPTTDWAVGEVVTDQHLVEFPDLPPGEYTLRVGMYDPATGQRLPADNGDTAILLQTVSIN